MTRLIFAVMGLVVGTLAGCTPEPASCPAVKGAFWAEYVYLPQYGGQACPIGPYPLTVDGGKTGSRVLTTMYSNQTIITDLVLKGCAVGLQVTINTAAGDPVAVVDGDMRVVSPDLLMGTVRGQSVDETGQWCDGIFEARLRRDDGAVQADCIPGSTCGDPQPVNMGTVFAGSGGS